MTSFEHGLMVSLSIMFVFNVLATLAPNPRDEVSGDNRLYFAMLAALCAGIAVAVVL